MKKVTIAVMGVAATLLVFLGNLYGQSPPAETGQERPAADVVTHDRCAKYKIYEADMKLKNNSGAIYLGTGMAPIGNDLGKVRETARQRALAEISSTIRVKVASDFKMITDYTKQSGKKRDTEDLRQSISEKVNTYTNIVLNDVKEGESFIDCPVENNLTLFMYLSKDQYQQKVTQDIQNKLAFLKGRIKEGDGYLSVGSYVNALRTYLDARNKLEAFFGDLPVYTAMGEEERLLPLYLNTKIARLVGGLTIESLNDNLLYNVDGVLEKTPRIMAAYVDELGRKQGVAGLPLAVSFVKGTGRQARSGLVTGKYGEADIPVEKVDASFPEVVVQVSIDWEALPGMAGSGVAANDTGALAVIMKRLKTVGLAISFDNLGSTATPGELKRQLVSLLSSNNYGVSEVSASGPSDLKNRPGLNVEYVLLINARSSGGGTVGGYQNMHVANCSGEVSLFRLPTVSLVATELVASAQGFGTSGSSAGWDAFGKIQSRLVEKAASILARID